MIAAAAGEDGAVALTRSAAAAAQRGGMSPFTPAAGRLRPELSASSARSQEVARYTKRLKPLIDRLLGSEFADADNRSLEYTALVARHVSRLLPEEYI